MKRLLSCDAALLRYRCLCFVQNFLKIGEWYVQAGCYLFPSLELSVTPKQGFSCEFSVTCVATGIPSELGVVPDSHTSRREVETGVKVTAV